MLSGSSSATHATARVTWPFDQVAVGDEIVDKAIGVGNPETDGGQNRRHIGALNQAARRCLDKRAQ